MRTIAAAPLLPALLVNLAIFVAPMLNLGALSVREGLPGGSIGDALTLATWQKVLADEFYWELVASSVGIALLITALTLVCAYPLALFVHRAGRWRNLLLVICIAPLLVSAVVRTYGWLVILGDGGLVASLLRAAGVMKPPRMVFNITGVVVGLVEILMPTMILSLLAGFGRLEAALEEAAASLGAAPFTVFRRVVLPLTLPGVLLGSLLAFVLAVSSFITPKLLGGGRVFLLATEIYDQAIVTLNWPVAATLSLLVLAIFGCALLLYGRAVRALDLIGRLSFRLLVLALFAFLLAPVILVIPMSFSADRMLTFPPSGFSLRWYQALLNEPGLVDATRNSLLLALFVTLASLAIGMPAALALARGNLPGQEAIMALLTAPLLLPTIVLALALLILFVSYGLVGSWIGLGLAHLLVALPYALRVLTTAIATLPAYVEEAAGSLGATPWQVFRRVTLPLMLPGMVATAAIVFLVSFDEAVISLFVVGPRLTTLPVALFRYVENRTDPLVAAASSLLVVVSLTLVVIVERAVGLGRAIGR